MQFGQLLTHLDTTQQMINTSLKDNTTLLTQVQSLHQGLKEMQQYFHTVYWIFFFSFSPLHQVQQTMKENLVAIEENFAALDQRMKKISK